VLIEEFTANVDVQWEHPAIARFFRRLGSFCRVATDAAATTSWPRSRSS
jgi:hypothetical protein